VIDLAEERFTKNLCRERASSQATHTQLGPAVRDEANQKPRLTVVEKVLENRELGLALIKSQAISCSGLPPSQRPLEVERPGATKSPFRPSFRPA